MDGSEADIARKAYQAQIQRGASHSGNLICGDRNKIV